MSGHQRMPAGGRSTAVSDWHPDVPQRDIPALRARNVTRTNARNSDRSRGRCALGHTGCSGSRTVENAARHPTLGGIVFRGVHRSAHDPSAESHPLLPARLHSARDHPPASPHENMSLTAPTRARPVPTASIAAPTPSQCLRTERSMSLIPTLTRPCHRPTTPPAAYTTAACTVGRHSTTARQPDSKLVSSCVSGDQTRGVVGWA